MRKIDFFDGAESSTTPTIGNIQASTILTYPDDATYESSNAGAPTEGNLYANTTTNEIRYYDGTNWTTVASTSTVQTLTNKTIDADLNTITNIGDSEIVAGVNASKIADGSISNTEFQYLDGTSSNIQDQIDDLDGLIMTLEADKQDLSEKGQINGYASLDGAGKVPISELPDSIVSGLNFQGLWNATTNTPTLSDGTGTDGHMYQVNVAGSQDLGSGSIDFTVGDFVIHNGSAWEKLEGGQVESVNGQTGAVSLELDDLTDVDLTIAPSNKQSLVYDSVSSTWKAGLAAGGSGQGKINFIENGTFEEDTENWLESDNTRLAIAFSATNPLVGEGSGVITKAASNASGARISKESKLIDIAYRGKPLFIEFKYDMSHVNYVSGDLILQVYDSTNVALLTVFPIANLDGSNGLLKGAATALAICYPPDTCEEVEFRLEVTTDNVPSDTWNGKIDDVLAGPDSATPTNRVVGATSFTPTGSWVSNTTYSGRKWSVGDRNFYQVFVSLSGSPGAGALTINLPDTIDTTKLPNSGADVLLGTCIFRDVVGTLPDTRRMQGGVEFLTSTSVRPHIVLVDQSNNHYQRTINNVSLTIDAGIVISMEFSVPIVNQATGNLMSSFEASLSSIKVMGAGNAGDSITALTTNIPFIEVKDNFGAWNGTDFVAPKDMDVLVQGCIASTAAVTTRVLAYVNAVQTKTLGVDTSSTEHPFSGVVSLTKGQSLTLRAAAMTLVNNAVDHWISITEWVPPLSVLGAYSDGVIPSGVTASRPTPVVGKTFFDTTLGIPIWYDGTNWVDATGTTV